MSQALSGGSPCGTIEASRPGVAPLIPLVITLALLGPFASKAFHLDDPLFLWSADQIRRQPLQPYTSAVNWYGVDQPMWFVMQNPPLHAYYLAAVRYVFGTSETTVHLAMLVPTLLCVLAVWDMSRAIGGRPELAAVWTVVTPVFLVSASTAMCDVPMLGWWCGACACWIRGMDRGRPGWLAAAAVMGGLAGWTKYFGMACPAILLAYAAVRHRRIGIWALWLAVPLAMYLLWHLWSRQLFGVSHVVQAVRYPSVFRGTTAATAHPMALVLPALSFAGGGLLLPLLLGRLVPRPRQLAGWTIAIVLVAVAFGPPLDGSEWKVQPGLWQWGQYALFVVGGAAALSLAVLHLNARRDAAAACLACWIVGTYAFAAFCNWTVSGRTVLPMAPAVAMLLAREISFGSAGWPPWRITVPTVCAAALALALVWVDTRWAAIQRQAALEIAPQYRARGGELWFSGHWGLQYYLESLGARGVQRTRPTIEPGDWLLQPRNNTGVDRLVPGTATLVERREYPHPRFLAVMKHEVGAGFYSSVWGPLPYAFGRVQPEIFEVFAPATAPREAPDPPRR